LTSISGLWQFEGKECLDQIDEKGAAYHAASVEKEQCFPGAVSSFLQTQLNGENIWGTDTVHVDVETMTLKGRLAILNTTVLQDQ